MNPFLKMKQMENQNNHTIIIARFKTDQEADAGQTALESIFEDVSAQTAQLFNAQNGVAEMADVAKIYAKHGLRNDIGWEQDYPVLTNEKDLAWALPTGAYIEDAQNLLLTLGATHVAIHQQNSDEDWRLAPHPMMMPLSEEELIEEELEDEERYSVMALQKRTLH